MRQLLLVLVLLSLSAFAHADCLPLANCMLNPLPPPETILSGGIITADACGGVKRITGGAVTTSTVDTFTRPSVANKNCWMAVCNVSANTITLDENANFIAAAATIALTTDDCVSVVSDGLVWRQVSALIAN